MTRLFVALALASFSLAAVAAPPVVQPFDVNVVNQPLTVTPLEPYTEIEDVISTVGTIQVPASVSTSTVMLGGPEDLILRGLTLDVSASATPAATSTCRGSIAIRNNAEVIVLSLADITVLSGSRDGRYVPMPNIRIPADFKLVVFVNNQTSGSCLIGFNAVTTKL